MWQFPNQGSNPCPLQWKCGVLTTGPPGKSTLTFDWTGRIPTCLSMFPAIAWGWEELSARNSSMRLKVFLWPCPAAAAGAPGVPGFATYSTRRDDSRQAAGAVPSRHEEWGGGAQGAEIALWTPQGPGREGTSHPAVLDLYTCCLVRRMMHIFM